MKYAIYDKWLSASISVFHCKFSHDLLYVLWSTRTHRSLTIVVLHGSESFGPRSILSNEHPSQPAKHVKTRAGGQTVPYPHTASSSHSSNMEPQFTIKLVVFTALSSNFGEIDQFETNPFLQLWPRKPQPRPPKPDMPGMPDWSPERPPMFKPDLSHKRNDGLVVDLFGFHHFGVSYWGYSKLQEVETPSGKLT